MAEINWRALGPYLAPLRTWWWLVAAAALLGAATSALIVQLRPVTYQTRALVQVGGLLTDPNITAFENNVSRDVARSFVDVARQAPIRRAVAEQLGLESLPAYDVQLLPGETMIAFTVSAGSAQLARDVANALAEELLAQSPSSIVAGSDERQGFISEQLSNLELDITAAEADLAAARAELADAAAGAASTEAADLVAAREQSLAALRNTYVALLSNANGRTASALTLFEPAPVPLRPLPRSWGVVPLSAVLGLVVAAGAAYLLPAPAPAPLPARSSRAGRRGAARPGRR